MNITLKALKIHKDMSEETLCFSASLCLDGKKVATVSNRGFGAPHEFWFTDRALEDKVYAWATAQDLPYDFEKLDQIVDRMITDTENDKRFKRHAKTKTLFRLEGDNEGDWRTISMPYSPTAQEWLDKKFGDKVIAIYGKGA